MSSTTCPPRTSFTVTTCCAMTPACAHRGAAASPEGSLGPVPSHPTTCTSALSTATHLGGPRLASLVRQQPLGLRPALERWIPEVIEAAATRSCVCDDN